MNCKTIAARQTGFSLIETVMSAAVAGVLATTAVPGMVGMRQSAEITTTTNELMSALHLARSEAVKRRARVAVSPNAGADWRTGWTVYVDRDDDGVFDEGNDDLVRVFPAVAKQAQITPHFGATSNGSALSYTPDGALRRPGTQGLLIGRLTLEHGNHVRSICAATMRLRTVRASTCS
jgi:type IV fimbrial biogenesis protein FimT